MSPQNNFARFSETPGPANGGPKMPEWPPRNPQVAGLNLGPVNALAASSPDEAYPEPAGPIDQTMAFHAGQVHSDVYITRHALEGNPGRQNLRLVSGAAQVWARDYPDRSSLIEVSADDSIRVHEGWVLINGRMRVGRHEGRWQPLRALAVEGWQDAPMLPRRWWIQLLGKRATEVL